MSRMCFACIETALKLLRERAKLLDLLPQPPGRCIGLHGEHQQAATVTKRECEAADLFPVRAWIQACTADSLEDTLEAACHDETHSGARSHRRGSTRWRDVGRPILVTALLAVTFAAPAAASIRHWTVRFAQLELRRYTPHPGFTLSSVQCEGLGRARTIRHLATYSQFRCGLDGDGEAVLADVTIVPVSATRFRVVQCSPIRPPLNNPFCR